MGRYGTAHGGRNLNDDVALEETRLWPTPAAADSTGGKIRKDIGPTGRMPDGSKGTVSLNQAIHMWPTPAAGLHNDGEDPDHWLERRERLRAEYSNGNGAGTPLAVAAKLADRGEEGKLWPTPSGSDAAGSRTLPPGTSETGARPDGKKAQVGLQNAVRLWPSPRASDGEKGGPNQRGSKGDLTLPSAVQEGRNWPTPTARDHKSGLASEETHARNARPLSEVVAREEANNWPTPQARDHRTGEADRHLEPARHGASNLNDAVAREDARLWPTPQARDGSHGGPADPEVRLAKGHSLGLDDQVRGAQAGVSGMLSWPWVESLMGFPAGWLDIPWPANGQPSDTPPPDDRDLRDFTGAPWSIAAHAWPARPGQPQFVGESPRTARGQAGRVARLKALGNAVVPAQAFPIFEAIVAVERGALAWEEPAADPAPQAPPAAPTLFDLDALVASGEGVAS